MYASRIKIRIGLLIAGSAVRRATHWNAVLHLRHYWHAGNAAVVFTEVDARCDTLATVVADLSTDSRTVNRGAINRGHTIAFIVIELSELLVVSLLLIALPHSI